MTPEQRLINSKVEHSARKALTPVIGNVYLEAGGKLITVKTRDRITVILGGNGTHIYMWRGRRVHHLRGAEREFVLFQSSIHNSRR